METKAPDSYMAHLAWIIPTVISLFGIVLDHMDWASTLLSKIWNLFFVNIWYLWVAAAGYGLYRFVRLIQKFHNVTNKVLPILTAADTKNQELALELTKKESASRVASIDTLSDRIISLDTRFKNDLDREVGALHAKLSEVMRKEERARSEGINAFQRELEKHFERLNKIETHLPQQVIKDIKEVETKLTTQITTLDKRVHKVESLLPFDMDARKSQGLINTASRVPTPDEVVANPGLGLINSISPHLSKEELLAEVLEKRPKKHH